MICTAGGRIQDASTSRRAAAVKGDTLDQLLAQTPASGSITPDSATAARLDKAAFTKAFGQTLATDQNVTNIVYRCSRGCGFTSKSPGGVRSHKKSCPNLTNAEREPCVTRASSELSSLMQELRHVSKEVGECAFNPIPKAGEFTVLRINKEVVAVPSTEFRSTMQFKSGDTALHLALRQNDAGDTPLPDVARALIQNGARLTRQNDAGETPMDVGNYPFPLKLQAVSEEPPHPEHSEEWDEPAPIVRTASLFIAEPEVRCAEAADKSSGKAAGKSSAGGAGKNLLTEHGNLRLPNSPHPVDLHQWEPIETWAAGELHRMNTEGGGLISRADYVAAGGSRSDFDRFDWDSDGKLAKNELEASASWRCPSCSALLTVRAGGWCWRCSRRSRIGGSDGKPGWMDRRASAPDRAPDSDVKGSAISIPRPIHPRVSNSQALPINTAEAKFNHFELAELN